MANVTSKCILYFGNRLDATKIANEMPLALTVLGAKLPSRITVYSLQQLCNLK